MAPLPQDPIQNPQSNVLTGEEVVISGISGLFPKSKNVLEFMDNLYNKVDMVTKDNLKFEHADLPQYSGKISSLEHFDAHFFRVTHIQAESMEPMGRKLLEQAYGAMFDAGVNPLIYKGKKIGVFIAAYNMESSNYITSITKKNNFVMSGAGLLCLDGKTRCFDKNGDGSAKSQAVGALFLQKAKDAKRIYAEVCSVKTEYGLTEGANFNQKREAKRIADFLNSVYRKSEVSPHKVEYVEAHGAANPEADANELEAIGRVFGKGKPVLVGCVKSNMGDSLPVSPLCSITKLCLAYYKGELPGNLHFDEPLETAAMQDGNVEVLTNNKGFKRGLTAVNNFSHTGTNGHIVLKGHYKPKDLKRYKMDIPRLVLVSGRHVKGVENIFNILKSQPVDPEFIGMLNNIYQVETPGFTCRGYTILDTADEQTIPLSQSTELFQGASPPLWLVYSGMGSQWAGMGAELMRIPIFAAAIKKCQKILERKGVDVLKIITSPEKTIFDNVFNCFIGIAAVQIGLTNILKELGVVADNIIGHSVGEIGCAYYDGCFTDEEMILVAYARGLVSIQTKLIKGSMAAVGLGYKHMLAICPPDIDIACHNSSEVCTISGPADVMKTFVAELKAKGIFAREVPCGNIAYHSRYIQDCGPGFLKSLKAIIKNPVKRSKNWISTSWPEDKWNDPIAEISSAEYHTNNLLSPVYFEEAAKIIPDNAVVVEVAPHGLMQAILKKSHPNCTHIPLTRRNNSNPLKFLFDAFGKLYQLGYNIKVDVMYPKIDYPVSTETSPLSHLVEWYHKDTWSITTYGKNAEDIKTVASRKLAISIQDEDYKFLEGHRREGNIVLPEAAMLFYVWETLAMYRNVGYQEISVFFRDVHFHTEVLMTREDTARLMFCINKGNNYFEVTRDNVLIANGHINTFVDKINGSFRNDLSNGDITDKETNMDFNLTSDDIYKILKLKGHCYQNNFQSIHSSSYQWNSTKIKMTSNWITFLDSLIQYNILRRDYDGVSVPMIIKNLTINVLEHLCKIKEMEKETNLIDAHFQEDCRLTTCGGVKINNIIFNDKPIIESESNVLEAISFCPVPKSDKTKEYKLINAIPGDIDSVQWVEVATRTNIINLVKVCYAAPSMKDVQNAVGLETKRSYGMDFSGIDSKGNRVMGLVAGGALASTVEPDCNLLWPVPKQWTLEEAATVPLPYIHAFYCLIVRGRLQKGQTIFVTGGAGALGQAVISISLSLGCTVYTCVSDMQKKRFLMRLFPNLNENHIGFSRDVGFFNMVVLNSVNKRCDLVINCATGFVRELSMKCVGSFGLFLDVTDYDMKHNRKMGMSYLDQDKTYVTVDLSLLFKPENIEEIKLLHKVISEGIANGIVKPLSHVLYSAKDVRKAFRLLSQSRNRGRVLLKIKDSDSSMIIPSVIPRMTYSSNGINLVVCDETNLGIQLTTHLIKRGARKFILHMETKVSGFLQTQLAKWNKMGATVRISTDNLENTINCVKNLHNKEHLHGIFIIKPKFKCDSSRFSLSVANLDDVSRNNHLELQNFVIFARTPESVTGKSLTSVLKNICDRRAEIGLPALLIQAELKHDNEENENLSLIRPMTVNTALKAIEISLKQNYTNVLAYNKTKDNTGFLEKIATIMGIKFMDAIDDKVRVNDLVCNELNIEELKFAIKEHFKLVFSTENIREMTFHSLRNICNHGIQVNTNFDGGLAAFYNFVDHDEINSTEIFIPMPTLSSSAEEEQNLHAKATNIMLISGFEGHHHIFKPVCDGLKIRATALQFGPDLCNESIQQIALNFIQRIKNRFTLEPRFYLLGYSFGVNVALEIAALLEKDGLLGVVYCLDSSPDALRVQLDAYLGKLTEVQLQNAVIKHLFHLMSGRRSYSLEEEMEKTDDWSLKVTKCVEKLKDYVTFSNEYKTDIIESFYNRIGLAKNYKPEFKLESELVLLKGISHPEAEKLHDDYGTEDRLPASPRQ